MQLQHNLNASPGSPSCERTYALLNSQIRKLTGSADAQMTMGYIVSKLLYSLNEATCKREPDHHHTVHEGKPYYRVNEKYLAEQLGYSERQASKVLQMLRDGYGLIEEAPEINYTMFCQSHADRTHCMTITNEGLKYYPELMAEIETWQYNHPTGFWFGGPDRKKRRKKSAPKPTQAPEPEKAPEQKPEEEPDEEPEEEVAYGNITNWSIQGPNDGLPF